MNEQIAENLNQIHKKMDSLAKESQRHTDQITLIAVSKRQSQDKITAALESGQRVFGENRVQEAQEHWQPRRANLPDLRLHLIGPLQTNKVKEAVALFDVIETLDRLKLAHTLAKEMKKQGRNIPCFIQVNTGAENQKSGVCVEDLPALLDEARATGLDIEGLMCIPPVDDPPALHFALLAKLAREHRLKSLSMGMSGDYDRAIPLGATHIRIGTAIFGTREKSI